MTALLWIRPVFAALLLALAVACVWSAYRDRGGNPRAGTGPPRIDNEAGR